MLSFVVICAASLCVVCIVFVASFLCTIFTLPPLYCLYRFLVHNFSHLGYKEHATIFHQDIQICSPLIVVLVLIMTFPILSKKTQGVGAVTILEVSENIGNRMHTSGTETNAILSPIPVVCGLIDTATSSCN
jgi:hypothetical protein